MQLLEEFLNLSRQEDHQQFIDAIYNRLNGDFGATPNIIRDEGYEDVLLSLYHEKDLDKTLLEEALLISLERFWEEENDTAFERSVNITIRLFKNHSYIGRFLPQTFNWSDRTKYNLNNAALELLANINLRDLDEWKIIYFSILNDFYKDIKSLKKPLLTVINAINQKEPIIEEIMWEKLIKNIADIEIPKKLLLHIISDQWILCYSKKSIECETTFIKSLTNTISKDISILHISHPELKYELKYAIEFLLKHPLDSGNKKLLNEFNIILSQYDYDGISEEIRKEKFFNHIVEQPKDLKEGIFEKILPSFYMPIYDTCTPAQRLYA